MNAPSPVSEKQLRELHIRVVEPRKVTRRALWYNKGLKYWK